MTAERQGKALRLGVGSIATMSLAPVMTKIAVESLPPLVAAGLGAAIVAVLLTGHRLARGGVEALLGTLRSPGLALFALAGGLASFLLYQGIAWTDPVTGGLLIQLSVPFGVVLSVLLLRERASRRAKLSIAITLAGFAGFLLARSHEALGGTTLHGSIALVLAALVFAYGSILSKPLAAEHGVGSLMAAASLVSATVLLAASALRYELWHTLAAATPSAYAALVATAVCGSLVGKLLFYRAIQVGSVTSASVVRSLGPVLVALYSLPFGLARLTLVEALAGLVCVAGLVAFAASPAPASQPAPMPRGVPGSAAPDPPAPAPAAGASGQGGVASQGVPAVTGRRV